MADIKISELSAALTVGDSDVLPMTASGTTVKVSTSLLKKHAIGDNDISALGDGSVTGAILNVKTASESADSNIAETMAQNGAHNLLPNTATSQVDNGITFTVNDNGTVTLSGSVGSDRNYSMLAVYDGTNYEFAGKTIIASGGGAIGQHLFMNLAGFDSGGNNVLDSYVREDNKTVAIPSSTKRLIVYIIISNEYAGSLPQTVYPMLRLSTDPSTEYAPHAMTNRELMEKVATKTLINDTTIKFYATGNVRTLHLLGTGIGTSDNWASMLGSENLPKNTVYAPCFVAGQNTPCCIYLASNGDIKLMDYQGAPFGSAGTADVTLTWCV